MVRRKNQKSQIETIKNKLVCGDALEVLKKLPDEIFDVGVTSPPYNKGEKFKGWLVDKVIYDKASDNKPEDIYQKEQIEVLNEIYRVTKKGGSFFYNHKIRWKNGQLLHPYEWIHKTKWLIRQELIWDRGIAGNIRGWRFWQVEERIYWLYKPKNNHDKGQELESRHALLTSIWRIRPETEIKHPAPFPIEIPTRCIYSILGDKKGCFVLDPYVGSGTTCVAAKILGHYYFGIDISPKYIKMAEERLKNYQKEIHKVYNEINLHKVQIPFSARKDKKIKIENLKTLL